MTVEKLFSFTKQLERNLEQLLEGKNCNEEKKLILVKNIEVVSKFNKIFLNASKELNHHDKFFS